MASVVHHPPRLRAVDRGEMDAPNRTPPPRSVSTTARPRTPLTQPGRHRKSVPSAIIVPSSHYQHYTPPPSLPAFLDYDDEDEDKDDRGLLTIHPRRLYFPLTATATTTPTRSQHRRSAIAPHTPNSPARPTLAMSMTIHSPSPRGFAQPPVPPPATRRRSSTTTSTTSSRSLSPPGRPSSRSERLLRDTLARDESMRERAGHHQQSFNASVPPMPPPPFTGSSTSSSSTSSSSAQQQRLTGNREYWRDVFDADCSCAPTAGPSSPRHMPRRMTSYTTTPNAADSFSTSPSRTKLQRSPHTFAGGDLSSPSSSALLFTDNGGIQALEKLLRSKSSNLSEKQRSMGEDEEYCYPGSTAAAIPSSSRRRSADLYARRGENGVRSAFTSPPSSPTLHAKNMKRMSAQHYPSHHHQQHHHQQLPSPPPTPPHTVSALSPSHFPPQSPSASSPPPTYASIQQSKEVEQLPKEGLGIYRTQSHTPQRHRRHESASGALFSTLQRTTSHGAYTPASARRASTSGGGGGAMTTGRVTPRSASVTRAGTSNGYYHYYPTPRASPESVEDEDEDEDEDEVPVPSQDEKRRMMGPPSSPSLFASTSTTTTSVPKSDASYTSSARSRGPSSSFDAHSASVQYRQIEGLVSFSAVGLGIPAASGVDEDGDGAGNGKESRGRSWFWKWR